MWVGYDADNMKELHEIKIHILKRLLFSDALRYSEIKPEEIEGSQFTFHLNELLTHELVTKDARGWYCLTAGGKNFAAKYDFDSHFPSLQAKHSVVVCAFRNDFQEVLLYTRLKNPFYGCQGFMTGKVQYGEQIIETAVRELYEETGLEGLPVIKAIRHYRVFDATTKKLLEDKVMYICVVNDPQGTLVSNEEGTFAWVQRDFAAEFVMNPLEEFAEIWDVVTAENSPIWFKEVDHFTNKF